MPKNRNMMKCSRPWLVPAVAVVAAMLMVTPGTALAGHGGHGWTDGDSYILLSEGQGATMMSGTTDDVKRARTLRTEGAPLLFLRRDGKAYVVRDVATLEKAQAIFKPQGELGRRQAALGAQQAALGKRQAALGRQQAEFGRKHAGGGSAYAQQQSELGRQQGELGAEQGKLGEQQAKLGREQERLSREAQAKFRALVDEALRRGLATPV